MGVPALSNQGVMGVTVLGALIILYFEKLTIIEIRQKRGEGALLLL